MEEYLAHISEGRSQSVSEHLQNVAEMSRDFAVENMKQICFTSGILHDAGKYLGDFQKRIWGNSSIRVEHSIVGAKIVQERYKISPAAALMLKLCIAGHHSGLPDCGSKADADYDSTLCGRLQRRTGDYSRFFDEINLLPEINSDSFNRYVMEDCKTPADLIEKFAFLTRYCFSCLTDADSIDTADFMTDSHSRELTADFIECLNLLNARYAKFSPVTELQKARTDIQNQVFAKKDDNSNLYLINMPTGSGKTLCSIKFALERAIKSGKKRIIYVIPYNSIIDQTYDEFQRIFGDKAEILRHQSTFLFENEESDDEDYSAKKNACENWNAKIIITTAVQFFDSIYGNKRGKLRKLHNMGDSIIVFDEIHTLPLEKTAPCLRAVEYITTLLSSEAVFLTATMPDFEKLFREYTSSSAKILNLTEDKSLFRYFRKCDYVYVGEQSDENLIGEFTSAPASLVIFNSRKNTRKFYELCGGRKYHLSTYMTPFDRMNVINSIKKELKELEKDYPNFEGVPDERKITVFSTSLIEAGIDLDFPAVFRELNGLDSILQAGGRCNREGKLKKATVKVFSLNGKVSSKSSITLNIINSYDDISCHEAVEEYYNKFYCFNGEKIDSQSISQMCDKIQCIPFASYRFNLIDSEQISVFVPRDEYSESIKEKIMERGVVNPRLIQKYLCSVHEEEFKSLLSQNVIDDYGSGVYCLKNPDYYKPDTGLAFEGEDIYI